MVRTIVEQGKSNMVIMDVFSKLIQNRIIFIDGTITEELANNVIAQMLHLESLNNETINIYINSYGGSVYDGLAIYDTSKVLKSPIRTVCVGKACSMGAILMLMGDTRSATRHSRFMLHQPSGGVLGSAEDIKITHEQMESLKNDLYNIITTKTTIKNPENLFKFDMWYNAEEALKVNIINEIL